MKIRKFLFNTQGEAGAFCDGVEYVNDSAVEILGMHEDVGEDGAAKFYVVIRDHDGQDDDDDHADDITLCTAEPGTTDCLVYTPADVPAKNGWRTVSQEWWCTSCLERYGFEIDEKQPGGEG